MELPVTLHIAGWILPVHPLFEAAGYVAGFQFYRMLRRRYADPISDSRRFTLFLGAVAGALVGSKLVALVPRLLDMLDGPLLAGKSIVGGLLGGLIAVEAAKKILGERASSGDLFTYPLLLGMICGRVGCFLAGLDDGTHGLPTSLPWGFDYGDGISRHPAQLYEILLLACLWFVLVSIESQLVSGARFKIFLMVYLAYRFGVDWLKPEPRIALGLSALQFACMGGLIYYAPWWIKPGRLLTGHDFERRGRGRRAVPAGRRMEKEIRR